MFGYSSYDSYFGINNSGPYTGMVPVMSTAPMYRPGGVGTIPGINAPKKKDHTELKAAVGIAAAVAAAVMVFKGKGKISTVFKKLFSKEGTETAAKTKVVDKIKTAFTGAADKIKGIFKKAPKKVEETATTVVNAAGDELNLSNRVVPEGTKEAQSSLLTVLKSIQEKVNSTPGVRPEDKVGDILK